MVDTIRSRSSLLTLFADNTSGDISAQDGRDFIVSAYQPQGIVQGRLTLESGVPVSTTDQTNKTDVFFTPFNGNLVALYDGTSWTLHNFSQMTLAIGTTTANLPHDVFLFNNSGTLTLQHVVWTNATTRATDIVLQDGVYVKSGATTHLYLGTFHTTSTTETQDTVGGSATNVGGKRFLWNLYNQVPREMRVYDETNAWSYEDDTIRQARNQSGSKCECVIGVPGTIIDAQVHSVVSIITNTVRAAKVGPGIDSTSTFATGSLIQGGFNTNDNIFAPVMGRYAGPLGIGYHYISWNEKGGADGDCFFVGDNGGDSQQTGMIVRFLN